MATTTATSVERILGDEAEDLLDPPLRDHPGRAPDAARPDLGRRHHDRRPTARRRSCARCRRCSTTAASAAPATSRSCPVDQGIEHSAAASFAPNPDYFDPVKIVELAIAAECNAVATTLGALGIAARQVRPPHPVPAQAQPQRVPDLPERVRPDHVRVGEAGPRDGLRRGGRDDLLRLTRVEAADRGGVGRPSPPPTSSAWRRCSGATCATRPSAPKDGGPDYHVAADLTSQANHLGVTIEADIIKQKLPETRRPRLHRPEVRQDGPAGLLAS